ncbi:MAG: BtpA/SgcQ family protein [bacterium]|nr:BtpA/SgcQ family protein [Planctomycetota bacterium]HIL51422.1 BtpA/SgcQ family protein [Planctomycetota bacterium]
MSTTRIDTSALFPERGTLIGMLHLGALPGTPFHHKSLDEIVQTAVHEARLLRDAGFECLMLENMGDRPYLAREVEPQVTSAMTRAALAVRAEVPELPLGLQILAGANHAALAVAHSTGAAFIRAEGFAFASVADEGLLESADAGPLLRYRRSLGAEGVAVFADVQKKHSSHALTADLDLAELTRGTLFCGADGVVITGVTTAAPTALDDLRCAAAGAGPAPVLVGSGVTPEAAADLVPLAAGLIVGSYIKRRGAWDQPVDSERAAEICRAVRAARG